LNADRAGCLRHQQLRVAAIAAGQPEGQPDRANRRQVGFIRLVVNRLAQRIQMQGADRVGVVAGGMVLDDKAVGGIALWHYRQAHADCVAAITT
jgi:hypothetical protein